MSNYQMVCLAKHLFTILLPSPYITECWTSIVENTTISLIIMIYY